MKKTTLWLAFHDDMADLSNEDPVSRESTRILAAGALSTQATYNLARWNEVFDMPVMAEDSSAIWKFYGFNDPEGCQMSASPGHFRDLAQFDFPEFNL